MKKIIKVLGGCFLLAMLTISCAEDGEPGPQGEQGEQGVQGEQGEKGDTGTANVVYSEWIGPLLGGGSSSTTQPLAEFDKNLYDPNTAVFLVYGTTETGGNVSALPLKLSETTYGFWVDPSRPDPSVGLIFLYRDEPTPTSVPIGRSIPTHFRYVIIPGGIPFSGRVNLPDFDDYEAVKEFYKIPN